MSAASAAFRGPPLVLFEAPAPSLESPPGLDQVESTMAELAQLGGGGRATRMVQEHLATGGKRLRARLALAAADALAATPADAIAWAAAVELLHNATLVHDDIQDGDVVRRGHPTVWSVHGADQAMNAGDFMLMLPYIAVSRVAGAVRGELSRAIAEHAVRTVCGQVDEIDLLGHERLTWNDYQDAVLGKTGALLGLPVYGAAVLAGRSLGQAKRLSDVFCQLGLLFQLQDDVLDLYGNKGRDQVGSDLFEGKVSALVVAYIERKPHDHQWLLELLRTPREQTDLNDVLDAIHEFVRSGALEDILDRIAAIGRDACESPALADVPMLARVARHLVDVASRPVAHCHHLSPIGASQ